MKIMGVESTKPNESDLAPPRSEESLALLFTERNGAQLNDPKHKITTDVVAGLNIWIGFVVSHAAAGQRAGGSRGSEQ